MSAHVLSEQTLTMIDNTVVSLSEQVGSFDVMKMAKRLAGDLRALILVYSSPEAVPPPLLQNTLKQLQNKVELEINKLDVKKGEILLFDNSNNFLIRQFKRNMFLKNTLFIHAETFIIIIIFR